MAYGYRFNEVGLGFNQVKDDTKILVVSANDPSKRTPCMESLGCHVEGAAPPHVDHNDQNTMIAGTFARIARKVPTPDPNILLEFREFVFKFCKEHFTPLDPSSDTSVETWLKNTNYPEWRQKELLQCWEDCGHHIEKKHKSCSCFMKDETYPTYKHARGIFSRSDEWKCFMGPITKLIENVIYSHPSFIKHVPVDKRPEYITQMLYVVGAVYIATDYTAFESSFAREVMNSCEMVLYQYMTSQLPEGRDWFTEVRRVLTGRNKCKFKRFNLEVDATRMSGEMSTSLGNGFTNLMVMSFLLKKLGGKGVGVVEGDDGLFRILGKIPSSEDFASLGFNIKLDVHYDLNTASFCGIIFDPMDKVNVTDPTEVLVNFGWSKTHYVRAKSTRKLELLKSKSLSYFHQYPGCPIIQELALYGLRMTKHIDIRRFIEKDRSMSMWEREQLLKALEKPLEKKDVPYNTRLLMDKVYGISPHEQIEIENYLSSLVELQPLNTVSIIGIMKTPWMDYFSTYVGMDQGDYPSLLVTEYKGELRQFAEHLSFGDSMVVSGQLNLI